MKIEVLYKREGRSSTEYFFLKKEGWLCCSGRTWDCFSSVFEATNKRKSTLQSSGTVNIMNVFMMGDRGFIHYKWSGLEFLNILKESPWP